MTGRGSRPLRALDLGLRIAGGAIVTALGLVFGVYCVFLAPLYWHGMPVPLVLVAALAGNPMLVWAAWTVTGRRGAGIAPAIAWCVPWFIAAQRSVGGDTLLGSQNAVGMSWVGLATFLAGPVAFAVAVYRLVNRRPPGLTPPVGSAAPSASPGRSSPPVRS